MPDTVRVYLVVDGHGDCRLTKRRPTLDWDEVAFPITVQIPPGWARVYDELGMTLTLPGVPPRVVSPSVGEPETAEDREAEDEVEA